MKATIVRPDGTRIEAEGTPEEIARLVPAPFVPVPFAQWPVCICLTSAWCPVHRQRWWTPIYGVNLNAAGGNALPVIYGSVQVAAHTELS